MKIKKNATAHTEQYFKHVCIVQFGLTQSFCLINYFQTQKNVNIIEIELHRVYCVGVEGLLVEPRL